MGRKTRFLVRSTVTALLLAGVAAIGVSADSGSATYAYLVAEGFLCGLDSSACPAIAIADNGDTIEIAGSGTFTIHPNSASGGGVFVHKDADGDVLVTGSWTATQLIGFHSYGSGAEQGLPPEFEGGKAQIRVHLVADIGLEADAILRVTCVLGDHIPAGAVEGVRLDVQDLLNFNGEVSGLTLFILD